MTSKILKKCKGGIRCLREHGFAYTLRLFLKKVLGCINKGFRVVGQKLGDGFIEVIWVHTYKNPTGGRFVYLFGKQICPRKRELTEKSPWVDPNHPMMYFKVNRIADYTIPCVQRWVNTAYRMRADYCFICDNKQLELRILKTVHFPDANVKFIPSERRYLQKNGKVVSDRWQNAAYAHLTPFYHAASSGEKTFWTIDADDTMFCFPEEKICAMLQNVQKITKERDISVISLDMWHSKEQGRHWSWGISFVNGNRDYFQLFQEDKDLSWAESENFPYRIKDWQINLDWYFTYLKLCKGLKAETFYVENAYFVHWGNFMRHPGMTSAVYCWHQGKLIFPIYRYVHCDEHAGFIDIATDCLPINIGLDFHNGVRYLNDCMTRVI